MKKIKSLIITAMFLVSLLVIINPVSAQPTVVWVDDDFDASTPGWGVTHFDKIQDGVDNVAVGGTVYVAAGTYSPSTNGESFPVVIDNNLTLIGGGEATTIIDAEGTNRVITVSAMISITVIITDVTVTRGNTGSYGGGISNDSILTLTDCTVSDNEAGAGGGIYNTGTLTMTNCTVSGNDAADSGGGIYSDGTITMTNCTVNDNYTDASGGGILNEGDDTLTMTDCTVSGNEAGNDGGGIYNWDTLTMTDCTVSENDADNDGGGIYNGGGTVTMTNCTVSENEAKGDAGDGGGIYNDNGPLTMTNCMLNGNDAGNRGGGIYNYIPTISTDTLTMTNCTVNDNHANSGGGINNGRGTLTMTNCTVSGNDVDEDESGGGITNGSDGILTMTNCTVSGNHAYDRGGGIHTNRAELTMTNCTVSGNDAGNRGGGIYNYRSTVHAKNTIIATNSCGSDGPDFDGDMNSYGYNLIGNTANCTINKIANPGTDITGANPMLGPLQNNGGPTMTHALLAGSPAIDAGDCTDKDGTPVTNDQRGVSRPQGAGCDIGAYEYMFLNSLQTQ